MVTIGCDLKNADLILSLGISKGPRITTPVYNYSERTGTGLIFLMGKYITVFDDNSISERNSNGTHRYGK